MSTTTVAPLTPYKGLAPFEDSELDALLFFGRERETEIVVSNLLASRLTVLYGPSGVGKSSILRAAVARRLRALEPDAEVVLLDDWAETPELPDADFLILDQFEEYFLYHGLEATDSRLAEQLAASRAHVLIALREDQLAQLDAFQVQLPNVFGNRLRLGQLDAVAARAAIVGPLDHWNAIAEPMGIETALVDEVLAQVATAPDRIEAPYLQLVMERVWEEEQAARSNVLRLETLARLGGAEAIVGAHLERALDALPQRDAEIATNALRFLVTPSRTKIAHTLDDLVGYTNESPVVLQHVLERLASQRVLRAGDGGRYEIFHDVLAEPVLVWRREHEARAALAAAQRRHRRLAVVAGASLALAAAMIALTAYAFSQRTEASKQRRTAQHQTEIALVQAKLAKQQKNKANALRKDALAQRKNAIAQRKAAVAAKAAAVANAQKADANARLAQANEQQAQAEAARANQNETVARASAARAKSSAAAAKTSAAAAQKSKRFAVKEASLAQHQALVATVGAYVATAEAKLGVDPVVSARAAVNAAALEHSNRVEDALRDSLLALHVRAIFPDGGGALNSAALSPDASRVALGSERGVLRIFDATSHKLLHQLDVGSAVNVVRFNAEGSLLVVGAAKTALLYDVSAGRVLHTLSPATGVLDAAFAGSSVVTGGTDFDTRIWDVGSGQLLATETATAAQTKLAVSPDGTRVAVLSNGQAIAHVYSVPGGKDVGTVQQPGEVTALAYSPDGKYLVTAGRRNGFVWDAQSLRPVATLSGHEAPITDVAFAPDGSVVTSSVDSSARVWNPATGESTFTLASQHQQKVLAVAVDPNGDIATASADNTVRFWEQPLGGTPLIFGGHTDSVIDVAFKRDGSELLSTSTDGTARLWDSTVPHLTTLGAHTGAITGVATRGDLVLSAGQDGTAKLWHNGTSTTLPHGGKVVRAVFDGNDVLTAGDDGTAKLWRGGSLVATYSHGAPLRTAALPLAGGVVTFGADGNVKAWTSGGTLRWSQSQGSALTAGAVSRAGVVASGASDGGIRLWSSGGTPLSTLHAHTSAVTSLAFSRDGKLLVSGGSDAVAYIWDVATGKQLHALIGHQNGITSVSFSPDDSRVLTSGVDGDVRIWRTSDGHQVERLKFHVSTVSQAAFSPNGQWVVTAGPSTVGIWQVRTGDLVYSLRTVKGNLTAATWASAQRVVAGDSSGNVTTFTCPVCVDQKALLAQAKARLAGLR